MANYTRSAIAAWIEKTKLKPEPYLPQSTREFAACFYSARIVHQ